MTDFVSTWNKDSFLTYPVGPLGLIAMPGTEEMGIKVKFQKGDASIELHKGEEEKKQ